MKKLFNTLLTSLMFIGCTLPPLAIENDAQSQSVNTILICAKQIDIFQLRINGAKPPKEAFEYYLKKVKKYTTNNIVVH
ncbi:MAG TPA: hypothetical protein ENK91_03965, partial [Bacteroidetes bacterium]|nr:hypothetical protein [Bacteroidota bacterium]